MHYVDIFSAGVRILSRLILALMITATVKADTAFDPHYAGFSISYRNITIPFKVFGIPVMPGQSVAISARDKGHYRVHISYGGLERQSPLQWRWTAPSTPGLQTMDIVRDDGAAMRLNILVMTPFNATQKDKLNGYRIGKYPATPLAGNPIYLAPKAFVEVTPDMIDIRLSPHFRLGQFLCKQQPDQWPKYLVLREQLPLQLERILGEVNRRGIRTDGFHIMSGYRTPWYNRVIGNGKYSRHLWGGAADIYIDTNKDGRMDDLNGNGRSDAGDARILHRIVEELAGHPYHREGKIGGIGLYGPRKHRGPFVHIDVRGHAAHWELL